MDSENPIRKYLNPVEWIRFIKFGATGILNTLVDYLLFALLAQVFMLNVYFSQVCGYLAGMLNSYLINRRWTFQTKQNFFSLQFFKFILSNLFVLVISVFLLKFFLDFSIPVLLAKLFTVCITMGVNFLISRLWVFR